MSNLAQTRRARTKFCLRFATAALLMLASGCGMFAASAPDMARAPVRTTQDPPVETPRLTALERLETLLRENARLQSELEFNERKLQAERKRSAELKAKLSALERELAEQRQACAAHSDKLERLEAEHQRTLDALLAERLARVRLEQQLVQRQLEQLRAGQKESHP